MSGRGPLESFCEHSELLASMEDCWFLEKGSIACNVLIFIVARYYFMKIEVFNSFKLHNVFPYLSRDMIDQFYVKSV
jgi:hypothetical protein